MDEKYDSPMYGSSRTGKTLPPKTRDDHGRNPFDFAQSQFMWFFQLLKGQGVSPDTAASVALGLYTASLSSVTPRTDPEPTPACVKQGD